MIRAGYQKQLEGLHTALIHMGALCEEAIACAVKGLLDDDRALREKAVQLEKDTDLKEREIESICVRLLLREQPVASDLRQITAAQRMVTDMERIGDQAADIAALAEAGEAGFLGEGGEGGKSSSGNEGGKSNLGLIVGGVHIGDMAEAVTEMLTACVDSFVAGDLRKAREVVMMDDRVDDLFRKVKGELLQMITEDPQSGGACLDLLMIAKYLERIGDHAVNIAEWVVYAISGERGDPA
ncbi:MAG: phosphate transport system regulatory protein PhoU [Spirochaetaceae bacterium]|jgi:phosphate transport system protein|nr:phosphate transport system regulatory protein PhoU [Spirochaetaceae bacterium]